MDEMIRHIKEELAKGHRLNLAILLNISVGHAGALGSNHVPTTLDD